MTAEGRVPAGRVQDTTMHVRRTVDGDPESLGWVFRHFTPFLRAEARYRLGRHAELERLVSPDDLVQEVWVTTLPKLGSIEPRAGRYTPVLLRFLSSVLVRTYANLVRRHLVDRSRPVAFRPSRFETVGLPGRYADVLTAAIRSESSRELMRRIDTLDAADREILVLRGVEQLDYALIAAKLGVTEVALRSRYHRALARLRSALPDEIAADLAS